MKQNAKQKVVLIIIKIGRRLFFGTFIHKNKHVIRTYNRLFRSAYKPGNELTVDFEGSKFMVPSDDVTIVPSLLNDNYEKYEFSLFRDRLKRGGIVIDVGANIGLYTVIASKQVGEKGKVYSFEPEPTNYNYLLKNTQINNCTNVVLEKTAVGEEKNTGVLYKESGSIGTHSMVRKNHSIQEAIKVAMTSLDAYFKIVPAIDIMKVDVEGYELSAFKGASKTLKKVKFLFFEFTSVDNVNVNEWASALNSFKHFYAINEKNNSLKRVELKSVLERNCVNVLATK